ncbi:DNA (cytosine-5-)-methyltransferase [Candidatus Gracilibacteria bacterium]|nr:DNA (cytosine-5-)-methyltransferase [Candidatus Gracilibacteria bacterium]
MGRQKRELRGNLCRAGGQALGLEQAGFEASVLVEIDVQACNTLRLNRPTWNVQETDVKLFSAAPYRGIELLAGGVPCPPFSIAGKQLGADDERDLFPEAIRLVDEARPIAVMLENVRGFLDVGFAAYRDALKTQLKALGYVSDIKLLQASDYGVSQLRPRVVIVAVQHPYSEHFSWPRPSTEVPVPVGILLSDLMGVNGWRLTEQWVQRASAIAPTIVGGSKKHGGPDLGPTRAKKAWAQLSVDGHGIADKAPAFDFEGMPRLTTRMVARIQGFPDSWQFSGRKTAAYRQIGNAFPPPVAAAVARQLQHTIRASRRVFAIREAAAGAIHPGKAKAHGLNSVNIFWRMSEKLCHQRNYVR